MTERRRLQLYVLLLWLAWSIAWFLEPADEALGLRLVRLLVLMVTAITTLVIGRRMEGCIQNGERPLRRPMLDVLIAVAFAAAATALVYFRPARMMWLLPIIVLGAYQLGLWRDEGHATPDRGQPETS